MTRIGCTKLETVCTAVAVGIFAAVMVTIVVMLGGCADALPKPVAVQVRTVEVPKAVPVPCVAAADIPVKTPTAMPDPHADTARLAAGASADLHNLVAENDKLRALLISCTKDITP